MKVDFDSKITDLRGEALRGEDGSDVTLASVSCTALLASYPDEQNLVPDAKVRRFRLAQQAIAGGEQDVKAEDVVELKNVLGKAYGPLVVGRAFDIIEPDGVTPLKAVQSEARLRRPGRADIRVDPAP